MVKICIFKISSVLYSKVKSYYIKHHFAGSQQPRKWGKLIQAAGGGIIGNGNKRSSVDNTSSLPLDADTNRIR